MLLEEGYNSGVALFAGVGLRCKSPIILRCDVQARARQQEADDLEVPHLRTDVHGGPASLAVHDINMLAF